MVRLYREGRFNQPRDSHEYIEDYKRRSSQGYAFFEDCLVDSPGSCVSVKMLYAIYKAHARARGVGVLGEEEFGSQIRTNFPALKRAKVTEPKPPDVVESSKPPKRVWCYEGLRPRCVGDPDELATGATWAEYKLLNKNDASRIATFEFEWRVDEWADVTQTEIPY